MKRLKRLNLVAAKYALWAWVIAVNLYIFFIGFTSFDAAMAATVAWQTAGGYGIDNQAIALYTTGVVYGWFER